MDDATILAQANDMIQAQQRTSPASASKPLASVCERILAKIDAMPDEGEAAQAARVDAQERHAIAERRDQWAKLSHRIGRRYADCTLDNFQADAGPQQLALEKVRAYAACLLEQLAAGRGGIFYGPPGTGKDHLASAILRCAVLEHGLSAEWIDGADLYGAVRDNISSLASERDFLRRFTSPAFLVLSDPLPPAGSVDSAYQLSMLFRAVDRRYRSMVSTIVTLNVADRAEAERRLTPNIIDRLGHDALAIHCNWGSYRR